MATADSRSEGGTYVLYMTCSCIPPSVKGSDWDLMFGAGSDEEALKIGERFFKQDHSNCEHRWPYWTVKKVVGTTVTYRRVGGGP